MIACQTELSNKNRQFFIFRETHHLGCSPRIYFGTYTFFIYVNDLERVFTHLKSIIYAEDDTNLFVQSKNLNSIKQHINSNLKKPNFW